MTDLKIISKIEKEFDVKLSSKDSDYGTNNSYTLNKGKRVYKLSLRVDKTTRIETLKLYISQLNALDELNINTANLGTLSFLEKLPNLRKFEAMRCDIKTISGIGKCNRLEHLDLAFNEISDLTPIKDLRKLTFLGLEYNKLKRLDKIIYLNNLNFLGLTNNPIKDYSKIHKLSNLRTLFIEKNELVDITFVSQLPELEKLYAGENKIEQIDALAKCKNLQIILLNNNKLTRIAPLKDLKNLVEIHCNNNLISSIDILEHLPNLVSADFSHNQIEKISSWAIKYSNQFYFADKLRSQGINLHNNPLQSPPPEIIEEGKEAMKRYFDRIAKEGDDYIYEAKVTVVGDGSAGKTSLTGRLLNEKAELPKGEERTRGIDIKDWTFKTEKGIKHIAHIWDFGGQDVYYPVHRFFITENSVFVLMASSRQSQHNFDYWIPTIYQFGGSSPIVIGQTCHGGNRVSWNDVGSYTGNPHFNILKKQPLGYFEVNLPNNNQGLQEIREAIIQQIVNLPQYGKLVPKSWLAIREEIARIKNTNPCIRFTQFVELCQHIKPNSFKTEQDVIDCCRFFHDIGILLWYSKSFELSKWVVLQPEWAMRAVYKIIDDLEIQNQQGHISPDDFYRIWTDDTYADKHNMLKEMLEQFKIAFPKRTAGGDYIMPARLASIPPERRWNETDAALRVEFRYEFMPRGLVNQVSAELGRYISKGNEVWNNAVNLQLPGYGKAECQIAEDFYNRKVTIQATGKDARALMLMAIDSLQSVTDGYRGVESEILVPCTCVECAGSKKPTMFAYNDLWEWSATRENVYCNKSGTMLRIDGLLYIAGAEKPVPQGSSDAPKDKKIVLFLASSNELKEDRREFELFINRENKRLNPSNIFIHLEMWEDFIDAMSKEGLQSEYNKTVKSSDIFVSLFFTKVGIYTAEEFAVAFGQYKETGKPFVYTYFKDAPVSMGSIKQEDINSQFEFEKKLKELKHYPTKYVDMNELKYEFRGQLDKLLPVL